MSLKSDPKMTIADLQEIPNAADEEKKHESVGSWYPMGVGGHQCIGRRITAAAVPAIVRAFLSFSFTENQDSQQSGNNVQASDDWMGSAFHISFKKPVNLEAADFWKQIQQKSATSTVPMGSTRIDGQTPPKDA